MFSSPCMSILIVLIAFATLVLCVAIGFLLIYDKHQREKEKLERYKIDIGATIDKSIPEILDLIISECFTDYQIKFLLPLQENFITEDREKEIRTALVAIVSDRISKTAMTKISVFYNIENISNIMADKIYICVMDYVVKHNSRYISRDDSK